MVLPSNEPSRRNGAREALLSWYRANDLGYPWRLSPDPYFVLVAEVMLQQTQASRVAEAFPRFVARFPHVAALGSASRADVLREWGGLGYPRRAVALHRAARAVADDHGGVVPSAVVVLQTLPGVGAYTAAAVASIAYGEPVAAIDTNVRRVLSRLAYGRDADDVPAASIRRAAAAWLAKTEPGDWNQAVMDLGRAVCKPVPRCDLCPLAPGCRFRANGGRARRRGIRRQPPFEGSMRQVRGAVLRYLRGDARATSIDAIAAALGLPVPRVGLAVNALELDGLVERTESGRIRLPR
jgi:A/G-specific adenine glycosylase